VGSSTITVTGGVYNYAAAGLQTNIDLGNIHAGGIFGTNSVALTKTANGATGYVENLAAALDLRTLRHRSNRFDCRVSSEGRLITHSFSKKTHLLQKGMGFSLPSTEVVGSTSALAPTRSALRAALCAGYTAVPMAQYCPRDSDCLNSEAHTPEPFAERIITASPSLGFLTNFFEDPFSQKRFQRDGEVAGVGQVRYRIDLLKALLRVPSHASR